MFNNLPKKISEWLRLIPVMVLVLAFSPGADVLAQCDPVLSGDSHVCTSSQTSYFASRGVIGSTLTWSLSGGGTIASVVNNETEATIDWADVEGGPYLLTVTESTAGCSASVQLQIFLENGLINLVCNDLVHVALDNLCQAEITPDMVLEAPDYGDDSYEVHLFDANFVPIPGNILGIEYLYDTVNVTVEHLCSGVSCSGQISVQNNIAPGLLCSDDIVEIACNESTDPEVIGFPLPAGSAIVNLGNNEYSVDVPGDCGGAYNLLYYDEVDDGNCGEDYDFVINRTWIATDEAGNSATCVQLFGALWGDLNNMAMPPHYDGLLQYMNHLPTFQCSDANAPHYWPYDYNPGPDITGFPQWEGCSNIQYYYEDLVFTLCGNARKIVRHWFILDWCTGQDFVYDQLIIIEDTEAPVVSQNIETFYFPTNPGECVGTVYPIPDPNVLFDCSDWTYTINYFLLDENGNETVFPTDEGVFEGPNGFGILDLPHDTTTIIYHIVDDCGHEATAYAKIIIFDEEAPTAVCDKHTVVSLTSDGTAKLYATSVDDGSNDNCSLEDMKVRRMSQPCGHPEDLAFGDFVNFCCADLGQTIQVVFRVYDAEGLYSDCMVEVVVQDKIPPQLLECPGDVTISCTQDYNNLNLTGGEPVVEDNCDNYSITKTDTEYLDDCGVGYVVRVWVIGDPIGGNVTCTQTITLEDADPLSYDDVNWPNDTSIPGCTNVNADPDITGVPVVDNETCKNIGMGYTDQLDHSYPGSCVRILREWKISDWCDEPGTEYITHTQIIDIIETEAPYFVDCQDVVENADNSNCDALITLSAIAEDDCTDDAQITYDWRIDFDKDGTIDLHGTGNTISRYFSYGSHVVYFRAYDNCGNVDECVSNIKVKDVKDPTPICLAKVTTTMMVDGSVPIRARDFNLCQCSSGSFDNCTPKEDLRFSFSADVNDTTRIFTCDDITNGVAETFDLEMWVTDLDGNNDFCNVQLVIMDNVHACEDILNAAASLGGFITDEFQNGMPEFEVDLEKDGELLTQELTDDEGQYVFEALDVYSTYKLAPKNENDPSHGVSTLDLILIQKHILGLINLDTPYKKIAADANNTGSITAADLLDIRSLILGLTEGYPKSDSWKFINENFEFANPDSPWDFEDEFVVDELYIDSDSINFIGIKVGDVNNTAIQQLSGGAIETRSDKSFVILANEAKIEANRQLEVPIILESTQNLTGFQFTLDYDASVLDLVSVSSELIMISERNMNYFRKGEGKFTMSWNNSQAHEFKANSELLTFVFVGKSNGQLAESMNINSSFTTAEAYDENLNVMDIEMRMVPELENEFMVYQNQPNPFSEETLVHFNLPESGEVILSVYDMQGKIVHQLQGHYSKGRNSILLNNEKLDYQGIYFFNISYGENSIMKKMIYSR